MYSMLQNVNKLCLDSRLGPTLSCLAAEKKLNSQISYFHTTTTMPLNQVRIGEMKLRKVGLRKEQANFEKEDVEEVDDGR